MKLFIFLLGLPGIAQGCLPVALERIFSVQERVVIVWNSETKVQHFIREPSFGTESKKMGFVVPVPTLPTLHEVKYGLIDDVFWEISDAESQLVAWENWSRFPSNDESMDAAESKDGLGIHSQFSIAGYDATIMKPKDAAAVVDWLKENGLPMPKGGEKWVDRYIKKDFHLVAFLFKNQTSDQGITPRTVRITFKADRPFYPYAEPDAVGPMQSRSWMVAMLSDLIMVPDMENPRLSFRGKTSDLGMRIEDGSKYMASLGLPKEWSGAAYLTSSYDESGAVRPFDDITWRSASRWMVPSERDGHMLLLMSQKAQRTFVMYVLKKSLPVVILGGFALIVLTVWILKRRARKRKMQSTQGVA